MKSLTRIISIFLLVLFFVIFNTSTAGHLIQATASYDDGIYSLSVEMEVHGNADSIRNLLVDFDKMKSYNSSVIHSKRLSSPEPQTTLGSIEIKDCILFFCATLVQVQKIQQLPSGDLQVTILPQFSDYSMGESHWHIIQQNKEHTLLHIDAVMAPKLWVPPLIGPSLVSNLLKNRAITMMEGLETLAHVD